MHDCTVVLLGMPWAECGNADSDEKPGVIAVQIALLHHVVRHVARLARLELSEEEVLDGLQVAEAYGTVSLDAPLADEEDASR